MIDTDIVFSHIWSWAIIYNDVCLALKVPFKYYQQSYKTNFLGIHNKSTLLINTAILPRGENFLLSWCQTPSPFYSLFFQLTTPPHFISNLKCRSEARRGHGISPTFIQMYIVTRYMTFHFLYITNILYLYSCFECNPELIYTNFTVVWRTLDLSNPKT